MMPNRDKIRKLMGKAIKDYHLIEDGDKVLVGLSGGKDSMALLELLAEQSKIFKPRFTVEAVYVRMRNIPYQSDEDYLTAFAASKDVPLHIVETSFDIQEDKKKTPCFLCSWYRRKKIFETAKTLGCSKLALGHHKDDIMQTAMMNLTFNGRLDTMPPLLKMDKFEMTIIRPLCLVRERDLQKMAKEEGYHQQIKNCPYEHETNRSDLKAIIRQLEEINPEFEYSLLHALERKSSMQD
ncbi:MAG: tRNA 2-thiocytidine(32) synthetase TtcA [Prevotella sp.]|nr:tRNA 2-thiocytidine(32) synthetase TtcA [Prevotella sp.]